MGKIEDLATAYENFARLPWDRSLPGPQKIWFIVYDPTQERRLRVRLKDFEVRTIKANHKWVTCDLSDTFAEWMSSYKYRDNYFETQEGLDTVLKNVFHEYVTNKLLSVINQDSVDEDTVVAVYGIASLFGFMRVSKLIDSVSPHIKGRLLVFFPGEYDNGCYRLLGARDGWNYHAVPIV